MAINKTTSDRYELENVNHPGQKRWVDKAMYVGMKRAFLKILPSSAPGLTVAQVQKQVLAHLPTDLYPGGAKSGWWSKAVQLDLEAKGTIVREKVTPLRFHKR